MIKMPAQTTINNNCSDLDIMAMRSTPNMVAELLECGSSEPGVLLLDYRPQAAYSQGHVQHALKVSIPNILLKRLENGSLKAGAFKSLINGEDGKKRFIEESQTASIILYDAKSRNCDINANSNSTFVLLLRRLKENGFRVGYLDGGFEAFASLYPNLCIKEDSSNSPDVSLPDLGFDKLRIDNSPEEKHEFQMDNFPVEILPYLYLGSKRESENRKLLRQFQISYVLNVTPNIPNHFENDGLKYLQIPVRDHWNQNLAEHFPEAIDFIDEARSSKSGILVHCHGGVSRSVTVTVAYLMQKRGLSLNDAYDFVKQRKTNIAPNVNFLDQLQEFESQLATSPCRYGRCTCSTVEGRKCLSPDPGFSSSSASSSERTTPLSTNASISSAESNLSFSYS